MAGGWISESQKRVEAHARVLEVAPLLLAIRGFLRSAESVDERALALADEAEGVVWKLVEHFRVGDKNECQDKG